MKKLILLTIMACGPNTNPDPSNPEPTTLTICQDLRLSCTEENHGNIITVFDKTYECYYTKCGNDLKLVWNVIPVYKGPK